MLDLLVKNATLPDGSIADIACAGGLITAIEPNIPAGRQCPSMPPAASSSPPFVDPHFHMDATLSLGRRG